MYKRVYQRVIDGRRVATKGLRLEVNILPRHSMYGILIHTLAVVEKGSM